MTDFDIVEKAIQGCEAVVHFACAIEEEPFKAVELDTRVLAFLLVAAEKAGVKKFIYTSSVTTIQGGVFNTLNIC